MRKILSKLRELPHAFQGFVSLSGLNGQEFAPFLTAAFNSQNFPTFVNALFKGAISIGAILAVLQLARAGFLYMTSDVWGDKEKAKHIMRDALVGLLLLMGIWLILRQINPQLLELNIVGRIKPLPAAPKLPSSSDSRPQNSFLAPDQDPSLQGCGIFGCGPENQPINNPGYAPAFFGPSKSISRIPDNNASASSFPL